MKGWLANKRVQLLVETGLVFTITTISGTAYMCGDLLKFTSKAAYRYGADLDALSLDLLDNSLKTINRFIWKEVLDD